MPDRIRFALRAATRAYLSHPWAHGLNILLTALVVWALT